MSGDPLTRAPASVPDRVECLGGPLDGTKVRPLGHAAFPWPNGHYALSGTAGAWVYGWQRDDFTDADRAQWQRDRRDRIPGPR